MASKGVRLCRLSGHEQGFGVLGWFPPDSLPHCCANLGSYSSLSFLVPKLRKTRGLKSEMRDVVGARWSDTTVLFKQDMSLCLVLGGAECC